MEELLVHIQDLKVGNIYSNADIVETFRCGNMGGMRKSNSTNTLMLVCDHTKGLYDDMWHGDVLHYTGMGKVGDQVLEGNQNKTLYESGHNGIAVHLFEVLEPAEYTYRGEVKLVDKPYRETQKDDNGNNRQVWMFPIKPIDSAHVVTPKKYTIPATKPVAPKVDTAKLLEQNADNPDFIEGLDDEILKAAAKSRGKLFPPERKVTTVQRDRDPYVSEHVKRRAKGICDLCAMPVPFKDKKGKPYMESHHVRWLANGGEDTIDNAVALCPNCHRKMHIVNDPGDVKALQATLAYYKRKGL